MIVKLLPEGIEVEAYPVLSGTNELLVKYPEDMLKKMGKRWDYIPKSNYEVVKYELGEEAFREE